MTPFSTLTPLYPSLLNISYNFYILSGLFISYYKSKLFYYDTVISEPDYK